MKKTIILIGLVIIALSMVGSANIENDVNLDRNNIDEDGTGYYSVNEITIDVNDEVIFNAVKGSDFGVQLIVAGDKNEMLDHINNGESITYQFTEPGSYYIQDRYTPTVDQITITVEDSETEPEPTYELK